MSGGGKKQTTTETRDPWGPAAPYLTDALSRAQNVANTPASYYGGPLTVGPTQAENNAWGKQFDYNQQTFGSGPSLNFGNTAGAYNNQLQGGAYGSMSGILPGIASQFGGASQIGRYGFNTNPNVSGFTPQYGQAGSLDARPALESALSGTPDYSGAQANIDAANAPLLRQFNNEVLPGLNSRATFLNNGTGGIKALGNILPELGSRMQQNATGVLEGERQRALQAQQQAAGLVSQGGLQAYGQGLQGAGLQSSLQQALAGQNLSTDQARAGAMGDYRSQLLGLGGLAGQFAGGANAATQGALNQSPSLYNLGQQPQDDLNRYAAWDRSLQEQALSADQQRFNYLRDQPQQMANWYGSLVPSYGQQGGTSTQTTQTRNSMGFGDLLSAGLGIGSMFLPGGAALGGLGALGGATAGAQALMQRQPLPGYNA